MAKKIVVNVIPEEIRMALADDGALLEVAVERTVSDHMVGNIYKGRVENVLPGMQAAFINIGNGKNAFLYAGDIFPHKSFQRLVEEDNLTVGAEIMLEIVKDAMGTKGPRATTHFSIPGRYVVVMPSVDYVGISRRIESAEERSRLRKLAEKIRPKGMGVIVRTVAEGHSEEELARDFQYLSNLWEALTVKAKRAKAPLLLYRDADLVIRIIRDHVKDDIEEVIIDDADAYARMVELAKFLSPDLVKKIHFYKGKTEIFTHYGIEDEWNRLADRRVDLKCGGYLIIDKTEALTVIDVNTGRFTGHSNLADTVFRANMEAVVEIARQLRLRDIGGIIVADFIDMQKESHKKAVLIELEARLKADNTKTNLLGLTELGLVEMTRKKARQTYEGTLYEPCPCCGGRGILQSTDTLVISILRQLRRISAKRAGAQLVIQMHPRIAESFAEKTVLSELENELGIELSVEAVDGIQPEVFSILEGKKALHRSDERKRVRKAPSKSINDDGVDNVTEMLGLTEEDLTPLLAEKFAMETVIDPADTLEARLNAMAGSLWGPLFDDTEQDELLTPGDLPPTNEAEKTEAEKTETDVDKASKKTRRRRRSNKMTIAEAIGLAAEDTAKQNQGSETVITAEPKILAPVEVVVAAKKSRRRRQPKKEIDDSSIAKSAEVQPEVKPLEEIELLVSIETDNEEKKTKRRRRRKKKPAAATETAEPVEVAETDLLTVDAMDAGDVAKQDNMVDETSTTVVKAKRRRRKKKKPVEDAVGQVEQPTEAIPPAEVPDGTSDTADSEEVVAKKSKRRRRKKKKPVDDSAETPLQLAEPASPATMDSENAEPTVVKKKRRRRRSSASKKSDVALTAGSEDTSD